MIAALLFNGIPSRKIKTHHSNENNSSFQMNPMGALSGGGMSGGVSDESDPPIIILSFSM